ALASMLVGWHWKLASVRRSVRPVPVLSFNLDRLWWCGVGALVIGLAGQYSYSHSGRTGENTSAYWYMLFQTSYPGMALCIVAMTLSPRHRSVFHWGMLTL